MSRRIPSSQPSRKSQHSTSIRRSHLSQPGPSSRAQKSITDFYDKEADQLPELINKLVRYVLLRDGKQPIKKSDMQKDVLAGHPRMFNKVIQGTIKILKSVYGFNLQILEGSSSICYVISNSLPYLNLVGEQLDVENRNNILILLVLSHIFMMNNECSESSLMEFLEAMNISFKEKHPLFGDVDDFVHKEMVKEKLLDAERDKNEKIVYSWGSKAECCISKMEVLKFISKIYHKPLKAWPQQLKQAQEQEEERRKDEDGTEQQQANDGSNSD